MDKQYFDWRGNEYTIGCNVVYAIAGHSSCTLHDGLLLEIIDKSSDNVRFRITSDFKLRISTGSEYRPSTIIHKLSNVAVAIPRAEKD